MTTLAISDGQMAAWRATSIDELLWYRAWCLADAHGHAWVHAVADHLGLDTCSPPPSLTPGLVEAAHAAYAARQPCGMGGIGSPFSPRAEAVPDYPWIVLHGRAGHTTGSGRLAWEINEGGTTTLTIWRPTPRCRIRPAWDCSPGVAVLRATLYPDGDLDVAEIGDFEARHAFALDAALRALGSRLPDSVLERGRLREGVASMLALIDAAEDRAEAEGF